MTTRFSRSAPMSWNASGSSPCGRNPQRSDWPSVCSVTWSTPLRRSIRTVLYLFAYSSNALISTFFPRLIAAPQPAGPQPRDGLRRAFEFIAAPQRAGPQPRDGLRRALRSDRPRHAGAVEDRLVDAARGDAVARRVELGDLALERAVEAVRRAAPGRQHDRVDGPDASLHAGIDVRDDHGRALDGAELGARRENDAPGVKPRVERRDGGDPDVLAHVEERRNHLDTLALLEEQLGGRERLLGVDVVDHDHARSHRRLTREHVAIRHDVLAVVARHGWDIRMRPGRDDDGIRALVQHRGRCGVRGPPDTHPELLDLGDQEADDAGVLGAGRRAGGEHHLPAPLGRLLEKQ